MFYPTTVPKYKLLLLHINWLPCPHLWWQHGLTSTSSKSKNWHLKSFITEAENTATLQTNQQAGSSFFLKQGQLFGKTCAFVSIGVYFRTSAPDTPKISIALRDLQDLSCSMFYAAGQMISLSSPLFFLFSLYFSSSSFSYDTARFANVVFC